MRKLYALFSLMVLALMANVNGAKSYTMTDYLVRVTGEQYSAIDGNPIDGMNGSYAYNYYYVSDEITIPFQFRIANYLSNSFKINGNGSVIMEKSWPAGTYDYNCYEGYNSMYYNQYIYTYSFGVSAGYPNHKIMPYEGGMQLAAGTSVYSYAITGTQPNQKVTIQTQHRRPNGGGDDASWQVVLKQQGISNILLLYTHTNPGASWVYDWGFGTYKVAMGVKNSGYGGNFVSILNNTSPPVGGTPTYSYYTVYDPSPNGIPDVNYRVFIAYDYDLQAVRNVNPSEQQIILKDVSQTLKTEISNEGKYNLSSATITRTITRLGDNVPAYNQTVTLSSGEIPSSFNSLTYSFPVAFTPTAYGIYRDTTTITSTNPADNFSGNNQTTSEFTVSPPNNIKAIAVLNPANNTRTPINIATPVQARFKNIGANDQINVPLSVVITNPSGTVVFRDTVYKASLKSSQIIDTTFKIDWTPTVNGAHEICAIALLGNDQLREDDKICSNSLVRYESDAAADAVFDPQADEEKPYKKRFKPTGIFESVGVADLFDIPARVRITRCSDGQLVYLADSTIPELNIDQGQVKFSFPSFTNLYDTKEITPGCYKMCVIARYPTDGDRTNDTACTTFSIIDRLKGTIEVGVGRRFQTIHAAVDSMRFRGIGGNLKLILTDASYSEDGETTVSTDEAAINFAGIEGLSDSSRVTWVPKAGVSPVITFTGNKPFDFYWGQGSPSYMTWDGMNQLNPTPAVAGADPSKRGITVVNTSTAAGAVFAMEYGYSHDITLKNMKLYGNGMYTNDSSAVVRLFNDQNQNIYLRGIRDTIETHAITIENNLIGKAKYGVSDMGLRPLFDIGLSMFRDRRNYGNVIARNTIGSATYPIGYAGIMYDHEEGLRIQRNEVSNVDASLSGSSTAFGIATNGAGNVVGTWVDGNKIHNIAGTSGARAIAFQQSATVYTNGSAGPNQQKSVLPTNTANRTTNNMVYDLRGVTNYPVIYYTFANNYFTGNDSVFNNSISTQNAKANVYMAQVSRPFVWDNILQTKNANGTATANYVFSVPRPMNMNISSDYNLFDIPANENFAVVNEYDKSTGTYLQSRTFRRLNDWRTYTGQDLHSVEGNPNFASNDSLHMPGVLSNVVSPASNAGAWLYTASQKYDADGEVRLAGSLTPDIGADEFNGYQLANDLAVQTILRPAGYSRTSDTTLVVMENPLGITTVVKNVGYLAVSGKSVTAKVEVAISGGAYQQIYTQTKSNLIFDVGESKQLDFTGPALTNAQIANGVFRVTISVNNDQNNANNTLSKEFRVLLKNAAVLVTYESSTTKGLENRDSATAALRRLNVAYDSLDRVAYANVDVDYTPWWTMVWASGDPTVALNPANSNLGVGALSLKETEEVERFLNAGQTYAKKSLIMAGQNIALYNDGSNVNGNNITDAEFTRNYLHTRYIGNTPSMGGYDGYIMGAQVYFTLNQNFQDSISAFSPDVVYKAQITPPVGSEVTGIAYNYIMHPATPSDSGAGTTYHGPKTNVVFYAFDWSNVKQTVPGESGMNTSGVTRVMRGALEFVTSFKGTILPINFVNVTGVAAEEGNRLEWKVADQKDVARFDVELFQNNVWSTRGEVSSNTYAFLDKNVRVGATYMYRIVAVDLDGSRTNSQTVNVTRGAATAFGLSQNYPNPVPAATQASFTVTLPTDAVVSVRIMDVTGRTLSTLMDQKSLTAGQYPVSINSDNFPNGSFIYELTAVQPNGEVITLSKKMTIQK